MYIFFRRLTFDTLGLNYRVRNLLHNSVASAWGAYSIDIADMFVGWSFDTVLDLHHASKRKKQAGDLTSDSRSDVCAWTLVG